MIRLIPTLALLALIPTLGFSADPVPPDHAARMNESKTLFKDKIRPFFQQNCLECHSPAHGKVKGGFDIGTRESLLQGGDRGVAVVPGKAAISPLVRYVARLDEPHMPPKKPAPKEMVELLTRWIDLGAAYDSPLAESAAGRKPMTVTDKDKQYWAYRPLMPTSMPSVKDVEWCRTGIDRFLLARMEAAGITPAPVADKRTLIRRVTSDLIGLPPTVEEVEAFAADAAPNAYEKVVDRLLASPHFGERWARHWLDPARYAESHGFEHDYLRPNAYHYRDFVIKAFNADMPYDRFVRWQIAGDELAPSDPLALAATGFLGAGVYPTQITISEAERIRYDATDDMLATTGHAILGLTVGCARCHDHKFDPIPTRDYYRMLAAFTTTVRAEVEVDIATGTDKKSKRTTIQVCTEGAKPMRHHTSDGSIPDFYPETFFLRRGDVAQKDGPAAPGFLQVLSHSPEGDKHWQQTPPPGAKTSFRRTGLAQWLTDAPTGAGSLAARVMVNRLWHHHFGRGFVTTLNDFGLQAESPSHPELLEWLAGDLVANGWTLKRMHKHMVMSQAYQLSGSASPSARRLDPDNRLWSHRPRRRLEAEAIRDSALAVGGMLDPTLYGPGTLNPSMKRRSIYFTVKRSELIPMLQVFDWPDTLTSASARPTTTVAPQALVFLNNKEVREWSRGFAARLKPSLADGLPAVVGVAYRMAFAHPPSGREVKAGVAFLHERGTDAAKMDAALAEYALALMSVNEFIYVE